VCGEADRSVVMWSPCAGAALDPPLWIVPGPNKALSLALSLSLSLSLSLRVPTGRRGNRTPSPSRGVFRLFIFKVTGQWQAPYRDGTLGLRRGCLVDTWASGRPLGLGRGARRPRRRSSSGFPPLAPTMQAGQGSCKGLCTRHAGLDRSRWRHVLESGAKKRHGPGHLWERGPMRG
jgi:hypothetical protein